MTQSSNYLDLIFCRRKRKPSATLENVPSNPFESTLVLKKEIEPLPPTIRIERLFFVPEQNSIITIESKSISFWTLNDLKKKSSYSIPCLFLSSQNITFIAPASIFLVTTQAQKSSMFSIKHGMRMIKSCPVALPFSDYIASQKLVVSYGKDMLVLWNPFNNKVHYQQVESFHNVKFLSGINKIAFFIGLFCEFAILDLDRNLKPGRKHTIYSDDHSFGCLNQIEWIESTKTLLMTDSIMGKVMMWKLSGKKWIKTFELDKGGILLQSLMLSDDMFVCTWSLVDKRESYIIIPNSGKMIKMKKDIKKVKFFSRETGRILSIEGNSLYLFKY